MVLACLACQTELKRRNSRYCSNKCQGDFEYSEYIKSWKLGNAHGGRGVNAKNLSGHLIRHLREKYTSCSICGWDKTNPTTGRVPLEIDHIDGDSENNSEVNLRLICPNCHSLSPNFRNLNRGNGRSWRRLKYIRSNN